jgi:hypothetical protein
MRTIEIPKDEWSQLMEDLGRSDCDFIYLKLSSNSRKVWLKIKPSFHHEYERITSSLNNYNFIKEIHREVLKFNSQGKQFYIDEKEVRLFDGHDLVCKVKFV